MEPINKPDIENTDRNYWERVLRSHGLSMRKGESPKTWMDRGTETEREQDTVALVGGMDNLAGVEQQQIREQSGKVRPSGHGPDKEGSEGRN